MVDPKEDPTDPDPPFTYECRECGERVEAEDRPGECPECGGTMQNISQQSER